MKWLQPKAIARREYTPSKKQRPGRGGNERATSDQGILRWRLSISTAAIFIMAAGLFTILPSPPLPVYLEVRTTIVRLSLPDVEEIVDELALSFADVSGLNAVSAYSQAGMRSTVLARSSAGIVLVDSATEEGALTLSRLTASGPGEVVLSAATGRNTWLLELTCASSSCHGGRIQFERSGRHSFRLAGADGTVPFDSVPELKPLEGAVSASFDTRLMMNFQPSTSGQGVFLDQLSLDSISFDVTRERGSDPIAHKREIGGILSGTIEYTTLDTRTNVLRSGQPLRLELAEAKLQQFRFEGDTLLLAISGVAKKVSSGSPSRPVPLKPSLLEFLVTKYQLVFAIVMAGVPAAVAIIEWGSRK